MSIFKQGCITYGQYRMQKDIERLEREIFFQRNPMAKPLYETLDNIVWSGDVISESDKRQTVQAWVNGLSNLIRKGQS